MKCWLIAAMRSLRHTGSSKKARAAKLSVGFGRRRVAADVVARVLVDEHAALRIHGAFEGFADALLVAGNIILIADDEQGGDADSGKPLRVPVVVGRLIAPRGDGHHRFQVVALAGLEFGIAGGPRIEVAGGDGARGAALFAVARAGGGEGSVAAHGVADDGHARGIQQAVQKIAHLEGAGCERVDGEPLVGGAIEQRAR